MKIKVLRSLFKRTALFSMLGTAAMVIVEVGWAQFSNPVPVLNGLSPSGIKSGTPGFTLTVTGMNFANGAVVRWNGTARTTTYINPTLLNADIPSTDISTTGNVSITVFNPTPGGGESNVKNFEINTKSNTTTTLIGHLPNPSQLNQPVVVSYTVIASLGTPTGFVTVTDGTVSCSNSVALGSCVLTLNSTGTKTLLATYSGDANYNGSSAIAVHTVLGPIYLPVVGKAPTPTPTNTPTPTPTKTPTPTPTPIPNPIVNGGFEQGSYKWYGGLAIPYYNNPQGYDLTAQRNQLPSPVTPHSGDWVAWLGGYLNSQTNLQTADPFVVPAGGTTLRYWYWIQSDESNCDAINTDGAWIFFSTNQQQYTIDSYALCIASRSNNVWQKRDLDLSPYVGQSGWLSFVERNIGQNSNWFIDDVQLGTLTNGQFKPVSR